MSLILNGTDGITFPNSTEQASAGLVAGGTIATGTVTALSTNGITFPATQSASSDANTLDDYEEGTWTPSIDSSIAGTGRVTSVNGASYVKVGKQVTVKMYCGLSTFGSGGSGWIKISGLPFNASSDGAYSSISVGYFNALKANVAFVTGTIDPGGNFIEIRGVASSATQTTSLDWAIYAQGGMEFIISATYIASN